MNILVNRLPHKVHIDGREIEVNYGFKAFILIESCFSNAEGDEYQKAMDALSVFYKGNIPDDFEKAMNKLLWFYRCGREEKKQSGSGSAGSTVRAYDFEKDQFYIFAAFMQQYGINLAQIKNEDLHWWEFKAMFESLSDSCVFTKIMQFRTMDLKDLKGSQLKYYKRMKAEYALDRPTENVDAKMALMRRDQKMKDYIKKRYEEAGLCRQQ